MRKRKKNKFLLTKITLLVSFLFSVAVGLFYFVALSPFFDAERINVEGSHPYDAQKIKSFLSKQSIIESQFLAHFNSDSVIFWALAKKETFLDDKVFPSAGEVSVDVNFFEKKVDIFVKEKEIFGILCNNRDCFVFDKEGTIFKNAPRAEGTLILRVDDPYNGPIVFGYPFLGESNRVYEIFEVVNVVRGMGMYVSRVTLRDPAVREWEMSLSGGPDLYFGFDSLPADFSGVMGALHQKVGLGNVNYADFRVEGRIYYQ